MNMVCVCVCVSKIPRPLRYQRPDGMTKAMLLGLNESINEQLPSPQIYMTFRL